MSLMRFHFQVPFLEVVDGNVRLKRDSDHYYQIQGNLQHTNRQKCIYFVYAGKNWQHKEEILRDNELWEDKMFPKLNRYIIMLF